MNATRPLARYKHAQRLFRRVADLRAKWWLVIAGTGVAVAVIVLIGFLVAEMAGDRCFEFSWLARLFAAMAALCGAGVAVCRFAPVGIRLRDDEIALSIERAVPVFEGRFVASIQLARSNDRGISEGLVHALIAETVALDARSNFAHVVDTARLRTIGLVAGGIIAAAVALFFTDLRMNGVLLQRALLLNVDIPRATTISNITGDVTLGTGDGLTIAATAGGVIPGSGELLIETAAGAKHELKTEPDPLHPKRFQRAIESAQEPFRYRIRLNDATSAVFSVTLLARPVALGIDCEEVFPAYTKLPPAKLRIGDLSLLAGSRLNLKIRSGSELRNGFVRIAGAKSADIPVRIDPGVRSVMTATLAVPAAGATGFSVQLTDTRGIASRDAAVHPFEIIPDHPPAVKIVSPTDADITLAVNGSLRVGFEASDDFGVAAVVLHYSVTDFDNNGDPVTKDGAVPLTLEEPGAKTVARRFEWKPSQLNPRPKPGCEIEYWFEARDGNDVTGPGIGTSEHYRLWIITPEEKREELAKRLTQTFRTVNDITIDQEKLNGEMSTLIRKP